MQLSWSQNVKPASFIPRISIYLPKLFRQSLYHGHFGLGLDILGPFPRTICGFEYLFIAIDKFIKWPEVTPMRKVTAQSAIKFLKDLVCRLGVPTRIITNNDTQFMSHAFMQYVHALKSKISFASVSHPRRNGQAKRANAEVLHGLKTRTFDRLQKCGR